MYKEIVAYKNNRILFSNTEKQNYVTCRKMGKTGDQLK
jgi:hypothetical protein